MKDIILNCLTVVTVSVMGYSQDSGVVERQPIPKVEYKYQVENLKINSKFSDFSPMLYSDKLVFSSTRKDSSRVQIAQGNEYTSDLYMSDLSNLETKIKPKAFYANADALSNKLSAFVTPDGKTMYYTANNVKNGSIQKDSRGVSLLKIYRATLEGNEWKNITDLSFNNDSYNTAYPALSPDGKMLYFSSNMPGSVGQADLYRVSVGIDGNFGMPEKLSDKINTAGMELFPFVSQDNVLYFASNGLDGLGGLDIYMSRINPDGSLEVPENLGKGLNSLQDDFALVIDSAGKGYFSSNRIGGAGEEDIYAFIRHEEKSQTKALKVNLLSIKLAYTEEGKTDLIPAQEATVELYDEKSRFLKEEKSGSQGTVNFEFIPGKIYKIKASYPGYETSERLLSKTDTTKAKEFEIVFEKKNTEPTDPVVSPVEKKTVKTKAKGKKGKSKKTKGKAKAKKSKNAKGKAKAKKSVNKKKKK